MAKSSNRRLALSDDRIIGLIDYGIGKSAGFTESKLSKERTKVQEYFEGDRPKKAHQGDSGYVSQDVYDGVESMRAQLLEVFSGNTRPVKFAPGDNEDPASVHARTEYVNDVVFVQNRGFQMLSDVILNGLMGRAGVVKAWWDVQVKTEYFDLAASTLDELQAHLTQYPDREVHEIEINPDQTIKRVRLSFKKDVSQVRIKVLPPEEFGISPMAESIPSADLVFHKQEMTVSELIKAGYDPKIVKTLESNDRLWMAQESEKIQRFLHTDDLIGSRNDGQQEARKVVDVYECYLELDEEAGDTDEGSGVSQLYKITKVGNVILDKEPVDRKPFIAFIPLPRANAFWGHNYASKLIPTQNARTYLMRSIINHAITTNNPRLMVVRGAVDNPRELMENRYAGIVNVKRPDGIVPLPQAGLNPFIFQSIQLLDADKEEITGISQLSQGLNKDAISKQNSGDMVNELISVSQIRQKIVARSFAENFLRDLYTEVHRLVAENEDRAKIVMVAGSWTPIDFTAWPENVTMVVSFALGYGQQGKEIQKWLGIHKVLESVPSLAGQYTPAQQYFVMRQALVESGVPNTDQILLPPDKAQQPPPNPMQQAEIAMKQADAAVKQANAQAAVKQIELEMQKLQLAHEREMAQLALQNRKLDAEIQLKQDQLAHKVAVDAAEITLQQEAEANDKLTGSAMPTR